MLLVQSFANGAAEHRSTDNAEVKSKYKKLKELKPACEPGPHHQKVAVNQKSGQKLSMVLLSWCLVAQAGVGAVKFQDRHHGDGPQGSK